MNAKILLVFPLALSASLLAAAQADSGTPVLQA